MHDLQRRQSFWTVAWARRDGMRGLSQRAPERVRASGAPARHPCLCWRRRRFCQCAPVSTLVCTPQAILAPRQPIYVFEVSKSVQSFQNLQKCQSLSVLCLCRHCRAGAWDTGTCAAGWARFWQHAPASLLLKVLKLFEGFKAAILKSVRIFEKCSKFSKSFKVSEFMTTFARHPAAASRGIRQRHLRLGRRTHVQKQPQQQQSSLSCECHWCFSILGSQDLTIYLRS